MLLIIIYTVTALFLRYQPPPAAGALWLLSFTWAGLAMAFEFVFFGLVLGMPLSELLATYNVFAGRSWTAVVVGVLIGPPLIGKWLERYRRAR